MVEKIEMMDMSVKDWIMGFLGIVFIRFLLEGMSTPAANKFIASDALTIVHYGLFYFTAAMGSLIIIELLTHKGIQMAKVMLFFLSIMWFAPLLDFILSHGQGFHQSYIYDTGQLLVRDFFTFFGSSLLGGATPGIRIELLLVFVGIGWIIWNATRNLKKAILGFLFMYIFVFLLSALPAVVYSLAQIGVKTIETNATQYTIDLVSRTIDSQSLVRGFNVYLTRLLFVISIIFLFFWFWKIEKEKTKSVLKNSRPERALHYIILLGLGMWYGFMSGFGSISSWVDILGVACLVISFFSVWMFAVHINDCEDREIDEISNADRPLIQGKITEKEMRSSAIVWLAIALAGSWSAGYYPFFMMLVFIAASHVYSARPLRLKFIPGVSTFLMSIASLSSVLAGFLFISKNTAPYSPFYSFPTLAMFGILVCYTLLFNVKDLKDREGDKANGIMTIPVIFGERMGAYVCGGMFALSFLLTPLFFSFLPLYLAAVPSAAVGFYFTVRTPYKEKYLFMIYFAFIVVGLILFFPIHT